VLLIIIGVVGRVSIAQIDAFVNAAKRALAETAEAKVFGEEGAYFGEGGVLRHAAVGGRFAWFVSWLSAVCFWLFGVVRRLKAQ
jgi:hypothetical protein